MFCLDFEDDVVAWLLMPIVEAGNAVVRTVDLFPIQIPEPCCLASWFGAGSNRYLLGAFDNSDEVSGELSPLDQLK